MSGLDHKHFAGPEHGWEPEPGLPEHLPLGETQLWQGAPDAAVVARQVFHIRAVAVYFSLLLGWKLLADWHDGASFADSLLGTLKVAPLPILGLVLLYSLAVVVARTTLYTLTDKRLVMRIGMVLSVTYNIPLRQIAAADIRCDEGGAGDVTLSLVAGQRIAYAHLWPHARPWRLARPEPALRCLPEVAAVAHQLRSAWAAAQQQPGAAITAQLEPTASRDSQAGGRVDVLAGSGHA